MLTGRGLCDRLIPSPEVLPSVCVCVCVREREREREGGVLENVRQSERDQEQQ